MGRQGLTKERVVTEAGRLIDEVGLARLTLTALADRVDVAAPSLYKHVDGLPGLRRDLAVLSVRELADGLARNAVGVAGRDALERVATAYRQFARARPGLYVASLWAPAPGDDEHEAASSRALEVVHAVAAGYGLAGDDAIHAIRLIRSVLHGFVSLEAANGFAMEQSTAVTFEHLVDSLDAALTNWEPR